MCRTIVITTNRSAKVNPTESHLYRCKTPPPLPWRHSVFKAWIYFDFPTINNLTQFPTRYCWHSARKMMVSRYRRCLIGSASFQTIICITSGCGLIVDVTRSDIIRHGRVTYARLQTVPNESWQRTSGVMTAGVMVTCVMPLIWSMMNQWIIISSV